MRAGYGPTIPACSACLAGCKQLSIARLPVLTCRQHHCKPTKIQGASCTMKPSIRANSKCKIRNYGCTDVVAAP